MVLQEHFLGMILALARASWALLKRGRVKRLFFKAGEFFTLLRTYGQAQSLAEQRLACCRECSLFNSERQTCGTAGEWYFNRDTRRLEPFGCWCWLPVKVATKCNCWLYDRMILPAMTSKGWPKELNSFT